MQLLPPGICEAFFAGYCPVPNCPLRHESEIPQPGSDTAPSPPQPQPATAMDTTNGSSSLDAMQGVTQGSPVTSGPEDDAGTSPSSEGERTASHPTDAAPPPGNSGGVNAAEVGTTKKKSRKVCKVFVESGFCQNIDKCTLLHPEDDEDVDMEDLVEEEDTYKTRSVLTKT